MIKNIIFDFDYVIVDSVLLKTEAFKKLFEEFPTDKVDELIKYHLLNGGKSRYLKIRYFYEELLNKNITDEKVNQIAQLYSELTKLELSKEKYIIQDTFEFIKENYQNYKMHIASGADEKDLKFICDSLGLTKYFLSINGSPTVKTKIVKDILMKKQYKKEETILIGDSVNDYEAANVNNIEFYGFNNELLNQKYMYINNYKELNI